MLRNYLKIAWRNLIRNKFYSLINILGLSTGIACFMLVALFIQDELVYDQFHSKKDRIYRICEKLDARMSGKQPINQGPKARTVLAGGTVRSTEFPWRDYAQKVVLDDAFEGALVVRHGR